MKDATITILNPDGTESYSGTTGIRGCGNTTWGYYMYKDKGGKLHAGPVWDFDWETFTPANWFVAKDALYYKRLFQDATFVERVKERWEMLKAYEDRLEWLDSEINRM